MLLGKLNIDLISVDIRLDGRLTLHCKALHTEPEIQSKQTVMTPALQTNSPSEEEVLDNTKAMQSLTGCGAAKSGFRNVMTIFTQTNQQFSAFLKP